MDCESFLLSDTFKNVIDLILSFETFSINDLSLTRKLLTIYSDKIKR